MPNQIPTFKIWMSKWSFFKAACCSLVIPLATLPIGLLSLFLLSHISLPQSFTNFFPYDYVTMIVGFAFSIQMICLVLGVVSFIGSLKQGRKNVTGLAVLGILSSGIIGFFTYCLLLFCYHGGYRC